MFAEKNGSNVNRVFPEGKYESGSVSSERVTVNVKVTFSTAPVSNFVLFMRAFDIDDPSTDLTFVDPNDSGTSGTYEGGVGLTYTKDEDNRGLVSFLVNPSLPTKQKYGAFLDAIGSGINVSCDNQNLGIFRKTAVAGNAIFNVNFKVSKYPGDNYKIAMYGDKDFLMNLRNEDQFDQDRIVDKKTGTGGNCKPIESNYTSLPLAVFRTLHIECDKMRKANQIAPANENEEIINAYFTDFELLYYDDPKITVVRNVIDINGQSIQLNDGSISPQRFQGGAIKIGNLPLLPKAISKTETNSLVEVGYMNPDLVGKPSFAGLRCKITLNGHTINTYITKIEKSTDYKVFLAETQPTLQTFGGATVFLGGSDVPSCALTTIPNSNISFRLCSIKIPVIMKDDDDIDRLPYVFNSNDLDIVRKSYLPAYIDASFDGGGDESFNTENVPFKANMFTAGEIVSFYNSHAGSKSLEGVGYWISNVILGWQYQYKFDHDPKDELIVDLGLTPLSIEDRHCHVTKGGDISYICIENIRDVCLEKSIDIHDFNGYTMAHEIGHQFGLTHGFHEGANPDTDCATCVGSPCSKIGLMSADFEIIEVSKGFIPLHLNLLRSRETNPKF